MGNEKARHKVPHRGTLRVPPAKPKPKTADELWAAFEATVPGSDDAIRKLRAFRERCFSTDEPTDTEDE